MTILTRVGFAAALAASGAMVITPAAAAEMPAPMAMSGAVVPGTFDVQAVDAANHRGWNRGGWYRRNRTDAGDVIGAVVVIGAIAALANAASKSRTTRYRYPDPRYPQPYPQRPYDYRSGGPDRGFGGESGIDVAVDTCIRAVERETRIDTVDEAQRAGNGWRVSGRLRSGQAFSCRLGPDGHVEALDMGAGTRDLGAAEDRQWSEERYAAARQAEDRTPEASGPQPAYPGGPLPGDAAPADDGRYSAADSPDFSG